MLAKLTFVVALFAAITIVVACGEQRATTTTGTGTNTHGMTTASKPPPITEAQIARGRQLFQQKCGRCHTLADAGTNGTIGPNLDAHKPPFEEVQMVIAKGSGGVMPARLYEGEDAEIVAKYIANVAGN